MSQAMSRIIETAVVLLACVACTAHANARHPFHALVTDKHHQGNNMANGPPASGAPKPIDVSSWAGKSVLFVTAHPDDIEGALLERPTDCSLTRA